MSRTLSYVPRTLAVAVLLLTARSGSTAEPRPCAVYELGIQTGFPTGDWLISEHQDPCHAEQSYLFARKGRETRRLGATRELLALVPALHNEEEALALAAFLTAKSAYWSDLHCAAVPLRFSEPPRGKAPPLIEQAEQVRLDVPGPEVYSVDPSSILVSREGPAGPFVVERYLRCPEKDGRIALVRETLGPQGQYARKDLRALAPEERAGAASLRAGAPAEKSPALEGFRFLDVKLETSGTALFLPLDRKLHPYLVARGPDGELPVKSLSDLTRFVRIRNEPEALQYVRLLDGLHGLLPGLDCYDPVKTPGEQLAQRLHPPLTQKAGTEGSDLRLHSPPEGVTIDRSEIRLARSGPKGSFLVQRYLLCSPLGGKARLVLARETVGARGEYQRAEQKLLAEGDLH